MLFFGCRTSEDDYLYEDELSRYEADGVVKVDAVFSREGNPQRRYVQDAIIQRSDDVWDLIANKRANIYVCGNANTMAPGVRTALIQVFRMNSGASTDGNNWLAGLRAEGRFLEDIWGGGRIMAEPPITEPQAPPPAAPSPTGTHRPPNQAARRTIRHDGTRAAVCLTGILFAVLFVVALVLIYTTPTLSASDAEITAFYTGSSTVLVTVGIYLIPLAGIAFLWHAHTTRLLIKSRTPTPSAIPYGLQLVSGILFVVLLFAGTASAGAVALLKDLTNAPLPSADFVRGMLAVGYGMVFIYAIRGAGMYALTTTNLLRQARNHAHVAGRGELPAGGLPAVEHGDAPGGRAPLPHLGRDRRPGGLHPRRSGRRTGRIERQSA